MKLLCLLLLFTSCLCVTEVRPGIVTCACAQIQIQSDCLVQMNQINEIPVPACTWTSIPNATQTVAKGSCNNAIIGLETSTRIETYCSTIPMKNCHATIGCARLDGTCSPFTGCSAYLKTTSALCQSISLFCTTDGFQCMQKTTCTNYSVAQCTNPSTSGSGACKVLNQTCVDQDCSDVTSKSVCSAFSGCSWNGMACVTSLSLCASLPGDIKTCPTFIGSDGPCKYISGLNCSVQTCADAPTTIVTDDGCKNFISSCLVTTGKGCAQFLPPCSNYLQNNICQGYKGSDGTCVTDSTSTTACRAQQCSDAVTTLTTDALCDSFKTGCVTTGYGCTSQQGPCSAYNGTASTCLNYIGSDGKCKGLSTTTSASCAPKKCADNTSATTDSVCKEFQTGCITNGRGCVSILVSCSSYTVAANSPCDGLQGSDGYCTAPTSGGQCIPRNCSSATGNITTNAGCLAYSSTCVTNGQQCVPFNSSCESQPTVLQCQGSSTCLSTSVCNDNTTCASYLTQSLCTLNKAGPVEYKRPCTWNSIGNNCTGTLCSSLTGTKYVSDSACGSALIFNLQINKITLFLNQKKISSPGQLSNQLYQINNVQKFI